MIIKNVFYVKYRDYFFIRVSIEGEVDLLKVDYEHLTGISNYPIKFYLGHISSETFYTEDLARDITKKLQIALFCEQFILGSKYKTGPDFEIDVESFKELAEILDRADRINKDSMRTVIFGENIIW